MQDADDQHSRKGSIRARRKVMDDSRPVSREAEAPPRPSTPAREDSLSTVTRTPSMFMRVRSGTYQEIGHLLQDVSSSPTKALFAFVPVAVVAGALHLSDMLVFGLSFVALVPLGGFILYSVLFFTRDSALVGGLLRAVFGNVTELFLGVFALLHGKTQLAQGLMIGSILTYCLFVLGGSFLFASYGKKKEPFSKSRTSIMTSLVLSGSICLAIPTVINLAVEEKKFRQQNMENKNRGDEVNSDTLFLSRATSIVQILLFLAYLTFRFQTHQTIFPQNPNAPHLQQPSGARFNERPDRGRGQQAALTLLAVCCSAACAHFLVQTLPGAAETLGISESFAALVVLPQAGSLLKAVTIIRHTRSAVAGTLPERMSRLDFAIRSIMTNVFDTELFILPMLVMLGWAVGVPMKLSFGLFEAVVFLMAIMTMTYLVQHGKTTYFEGIMLMGTYLSMAIALYVRPEVTKSTLATTLATLGIGMR